MKNARSFSLISVAVAVLTWGLISPVPAHAQDTTQLEAECVVFISAGGFSVPDTLTPQELCKALVALFGNEWVKAAKLEATMAVVNDLATRLAAAEATIAQLLADLGAVQAQIIDNTTRITALEAAPINFQTQIAAINTKLANMAAALQ